MGKLLKKVLYVLLSFVFVVCAFGLIACGGDKNEKIEKSITFDKTSISIEVSGEQTLTLTLKGIELNNIKWTSSDTDIATVDNGVVKAISVGVADITAKYEDIVATCKVVVVANSIAPYLTVNKKQINIYKGDSFSIDGYITYNGEIVNDCNFLYSSNNADISVSNEGLITGNKYGNAEITVSATYMNVNLVEKVFVEVIPDIQLFVVSGGNEITNYNLSYSFGESYTFSLKTSCSNEINASGEINGQDYLLSYDDSVLEIEEISTNLFNVLTKKTGNTDVKISSKYTVQDYGEYNYETTLTFSISKYYITKTDKTYFEIEKEKGFATDISLLDSRLANTSDIVRIYDKDNVDINFSIDSQKEISFNQSDIANLPYDESNIFIETEQGVFEVKSFVFDVAISSADHFRSTILDNMDKYIVLTNDLNFSSITDFKQIGGYKSGSELAFTGTFNGLGHAITNLTVTGAESDYESMYSTASVFGLINGATIKNVYVDFKVSGLQRGVGFIGIAYYNVSNVSNVYAKMTHTGCALGSGVGAIVCWNYKAYIKNCVGEISLINCPDAHYIGTVCGMNYVGNAIVNCYGITNGVEPIYGYLDGTLLGDTVCACCSALKNNPVDCAVYKDYGEFVQAVSNDGILNSFNEYWSLKDDQVYFGNKQVTRNVVLKNSEYSGMVDLSKQTFEVSTEVAGINANDVISVYYNDKAITSSVNNGKIVLNVSDIVGYMGNEVQLVLSTSSSNYVIKCLVADVVINTASEFRSKVANNMDKYIVLGADLDFTGVHFYQIGGYSDSMTFKGTLDGLGHSITNMVIEDPVSGDDLSCYKKDKYASYSVIGCLDNGATIKNLAIDFTANNASGVGGIGLVAMTYNGTSYISNVYSKMTVKNNTGIGAGAIVGWNYNGKLDNCIGEIVFGGNVTDKHYIGTAVGINYRVVGYINNCIGVNEENAMVYGYPNGTLVGCGVVACDTGSKAGEPSDRTTNSGNKGSVANIIADVDFTTNGWSSYWKVENNKLYFGEYNIK